MRLLLLLIIAAALARDYTVSFRETIDFKTLRDPKTNALAQEMAWEDQGAFVFHALQDVAESSQARVVSFLKSKKQQFTSFWINNVIILTDPTEEVLKELSQHEEIESIAPSQFGMPVFPIQNETAPATPKGKEPEIEWNVQWVKAPEAWKKGFKGKGIVVANLDTGVYLHEDLLKKYRGYNEDGTIDHDYNWFDASVRGKCNEPCDQYAHGTHTMGTMVASGEERIVGMAPEAKWIACRNEMLFSVEKQFLECFQWFLAPFKRDRSSPDPSKRPHVVNHSWGFMKRNLPFNKAIDALHAAGVLQVFAAGNEGSRCSSLRHPQSEDSVITVGALAKESDDLVYFSSRGPPQKEIGNFVKPNVVAPGENVNSCRPSRTGYQQMSGTSMACPATTGYIALLLSARNDLIGKIDEIKKVVYAAAANHESEECSSPQPVPNNLYGWGKIDASKLKKKKERERCLFI